MRPTTRYAKSGEYSIAYQVIGDAALDLVVVPGFVSHLEHAWENPAYAHFLERLASFSRLILLTSAAPVCRIASRSRSSPVSTSAWTMCAR